MKDGAGIGPRRRARGSARRRPRDPSARGGAARLAAVGLVVLGFGVWLFRYEPALEMEPQPLEPPSAPAAKPVVTPPVALAPTPATPDASDSGPVWRRQLDAGLDAIERGEIELAETAFLNALLAAEKADGPALATVAERLGRHHAERLQFNDAIQHLEQALAVRMFESGPTAQASIRLALELGRVYRQMGLPDAAIDHLNAAIEALIRVHGADHPALADAYQARGDAARVLGRGTQARDDYRRALEIAESRYHPTHPTIVTLRERLSAR